MATERYPRSEERWNSITHTLGALLGIAALVLLIVQAASVGRTGSVLAVIVYGVAMVLLFVFSALHHAIDRPNLKQLFLALDHCGIYLLIAGTYTPFSLLMPAGQEWTLLVLIWGLAITGIIIQMIAFLTGRSDSYEKFAFVLYLAMGWLPILWAGEEVFGVLASTGLSLLVAGGIAYSVGVIFYLWKRLPYGHAIWHLFVVAGSAFHFFSIIHYVVPAVA